MKKITYLLFASILIILPECGRKGPEEPIDITPPTVTATSPAYQAQNVPVNISNITATFSEEMDPATINDQTISLTASGTTVSAIAGSVAYKDLTVLFTPAHLLMPNTTYVFTIEPGVKDLAGNAMATESICLFSTGSGTIDTTPPQVTNAGPTGSAVSVFTPISVTFSEPMDPNTINADTFKVGSGTPLVPQAVTLDNSRTTASFIVNGSLSYSVSYTVTVLAAGATTAGVKDLAGNTLAANYTWSFTTESQPPAQTYTLTVTKTGSGSGTVAANTGSLSWNGNTGSAAYAAGTSVILSATNDTGSTFAGWTGCDSIQATQCQVTMSASKSIGAVFTAKTYTVTPTAGANGTISPDTPQQVPYRGTAAFTITPDTGYRISGVTGCGGALSGNTYTTGLITADCTVTASFAGSVLTVTPVSGANGSISPNAPQQVGYNGTAAFTVTPDPGYFISSVNGCNGTLAGDIYTTGPVVADCTVNAVFAGGILTVTPNAGPNGTISPNTPQQAGFNSTLTFTLTPDPGYLIGSVTGCEGTLNGNVYTTGPITADCAVNADFSGTILIVTPTATKHGTISPDTPQQVAYNDTVTFIVTADPGYAISDVTGCGGALADNSYTTGPVTSDCTVKAGFLQIH